VFSVSLAVCGADHTIARRCGLQLNLRRKAQPVETFELDGIPSFNQDEEQNPPAKVTELKRRIREADAICLLRRNTIEGVLKNAIDWASRPHGDSAWNDKPAAIMGASTGAIGTARAQNHLRQILVYLNMFPIRQVCHYSQTTAGR
jgi:chromate reductase